MGLRAALQTAMGVFGPLVFNAVYAARFPQPYPTRTTIECGLMIDAKVEITVVAKVR